MSPRLTITVALLFLTSISATLAQTPNDLVVQGRAALVATNIIEANDRFAQAVALAPDHGAANVLYAATRLLTLPYQAPLNDFFTRIGLSATGRSIYNWTASLPKDTNHVVLAPAGVSAAEFTAVLRANLLPAIAAAERNLAKVRNTAFILNVKSNETRVGDVTLDYGDILMLRAIFHVQQYFLYTLYSWNIDVQLSAIRSLAMEGKLSFEQLLTDYPHLLTFATTEDMGSAKLAFENAVEMYLQASQFIRSRPPEVMRLFNYDPEMEEGEAKFRTTLLDLKKSLNEAVPLTLDTNFTFFLSSHFNGQHSPRSFLPLFRGNAFGLGTAPDPTFGGLIQGITRDDVDRVFAEKLHFDTLPTIFDADRVDAQFGFPINVAKERGYVIQTSVNLRDWTDHTAFVSVGRKHRFVDTNSGALPHRFYRVIDRTKNMPPPANDTFSKRMRIPFANVPVLSYTHSATSEAEEPWLGGIKTIWFTWTSPFTGQAVARSESDLRLNVFTWSFASGLTTIAEDYSQVRWPVQAGQTYEIGIGAWRDVGVELVITQAPTLTISNPSEGARFTAPSDVRITASATDPDGQVVEMGIFSWPELEFRSASSAVDFVWRNPPPGDYNVYVEAKDNFGAYAGQSRRITVVPPNDDFVNATVIDGGSATVTGSNGGSSKEPAEPNHGGDQGGRSVWWKWTPSATAAVTIQTAIADRWGNRFDPLLDLYRMSLASGLTRPEDARRATSDGVAQISFSATAGTTYYIAVDGRFAQTGTVTLKLLPTQPPQIRITSPNAGLVSTSRSLTIIAEATDNDGNVVQVDFYDWGNWRGTANASPYTFGWENVYVGFQELTAKATDNMGAFTFSSPVRIETRSQ